MLDPEQLRQFIAVADHLSFTRAAEELYISHSTLSRSVSRLETQLGAPLLSRSTRAVALTEAGEMLARRGRLLLEETEALEREVTALGRPDTPQLRLVSFNFFDSHVFSLLEQFHREQPQVDLSLQFRRPEAVLSEVQAGGADVGISFDFALDKTPGLDMLPLSRGEFVVLTARSHPLAGRDSVSVDDPLMEPPLLPEALDYRFITDIRRSLDRDRSGEVREALPLDTLVLRVKANLGIGLLPEHTARQVGGGCAMLSLDGLDTGYQVVMFWRQENRSRVLWSFVEHFRGRDMTPNA